MKGERFPFPKSYRLTKTDEYSSVFGFRRAIRGRFFLLNYFPRENIEAGARLGIVVGKKYLKSSVRRNVIKRLARENFRLHRAELPAMDVVIRLAGKLARIERAEISADLLVLFDKLRRGPKRVRTEETGDKHG